MKNKIFLLCLLTGYFLFSGSLRADENEWRSLGPGGGWISALRIAPSDTGVMYAGTWAGGMYKTTDGGKVWGAINHGLPARPFGPEYWRRDNNYSIYIIRVDTFDPRTVYVGTHGAGLYKTSDGGSSWTALNSVIPDTSNIHVLAMDPLHPDTLYTATAKNRGTVFKTTDGGYSWIQLRKEVPENGLIESIAVHPDTTDILYLSASGRGVFKSTDGGESWNFLSLEWGTLYWIVLINPHDTQKMYAIHHGREWYWPSKSTDGGKTWMSLTFLGGNPLTLFLAMDPSVQPNILYAVTFISDIYRSDDEGESWTSIWDGLSGTNWFEAATGVLDINPVVPQTIYFANTAGMFRSGDRGAHWSSWGHGIHNTHIAALACDPGDTGTIYAGGYESGNFKSTDGGETWSPINEGMTSLVVYCLAVDPANTNVVYSGGAGGLYTSTDGGLEWARIQNNRTEALDIDPQDSRILYSGVYSAGDGALLKTTDGGEHWEETINFSAHIHDICIDPSNTHVVYVGTRLHLWKSEDAGLSANSLLEEFVNSIAVDPTNPQTVYAGTQYNGLFKTTDGGTTWTRMDNGLPDSNVQSVLIDPARSQTVYAGTEGSIGRNSITG